MLTTRAIFSKTMLFMLVATIVAAGSADGATVASRSAARAVTTQNRAKTTANKSVVSRAAKSATTTKNSRGTKSVAARATSRSYATKRGVTARALTPMGQIAIDNQDRVALEDDGTVDILVNQDMYDNNDVIKAFVDVTRSTIEDSGSDLVMRLVVKKRDGKFWLPNLTGVLSLSNYQLENNDYYESDGTPIGISGASVQKNSRISGTSRGTTTSSDSCVMNYDCNGGSGSMDDTGYPRYNGTLADATMCSNPGKTFAGWKIDNVIMQAGATYGCGFARDQVTAKALWKGNCTLYFDCNGGTQVQGKTMSQTINFGERVVLAGDKCTRGNVSFRGWTVGNDLHVYSPNVATQEAWQNYNAGHPNYTMTWPEYQRMEESAFTCDSGGVFYMKAAWGDAGDGNDYSVKFSGCSNDSFNRLLTGLSYGDAVSVPSLSGCGVEAPGCTTATWSVYSGQEANFTPGGDNLDWDWFTSGQKEIYFWAVGDKCGQCNRSTKFEVRDTRCDDDSSLPEHCVKTGCRCLNNYASQNGSCEFSPNTDNTRCNVKYDCAGGDGSAPARSEIVPVRTSINLADGDSCGTDSQGRKFAGWLINGVKKQAGSSFSCDEDAEITATALYSADNMCRVEYNCGSVSQPDQIEENGKTYYYNAQQDRYLDAGGNIYGGYNGFDGAHYTGNGAGISPSRYVDKGGYVTLDGGTGCGKTNWSNATNMYGKPAYSDGGTVKNWKIYNRDTNGFDIFNVNTPVQCNKDVVTAYAEYNDPVPTPCVVEYYCDSNEDVETPLTTNVARTYGSDVWLYEPKNGLETIEPTATETVAYGEAATRLYNDIPCSKANNDVIGWYQFSRTLDDEGEWQPAWESVISFSTYRPTMECDYGGDVMQFRPKYREIDPDKQRTITFTCGTIDGNTVTGTPPESATCYDDDDFGNTTYDDIDHYMLPTSATGCAALTGYTLVGWRGKSDVSTGDVTYYLRSNSNRDCPSEDRTMRAVWSNQYTVSFDRNGGEGTQPSDVTVTYYNAMPDLSVAAPIKSGYVFMGWYDNPDYTQGTKYYNADGTSAHVWDNASSANATLYAGWAGACTVTYSCGEINGDAVPGNAPTQHEPVAFNTPVDLKEPTNCQGNLANGTFAGYQVGSYENLYQLTTPYYCNVNGTVVATAQWEVTSD